MNKELKEMDLKINKVYDGYLSLLEKRAEIEKNLVSKFIEDMIKYFQNNKMTVIKDYKNNTFFEVKFDDYLKNNTKEIFDRVYIEGFNNKINLSISTYKNKIIIFPHIEKINNTIVKDFCERFNINDVVYA